MRALIIILTLVISNITYGQENWVRVSGDTFYYAFNSDWEPIEPHEAATYTRKAWPLDDQLFFVYDYYKNGEIQMKATARNHDPLSFEEYVSGQIRYSCSGDTLSYYKYNDTSALHGKYQTFFESGVLESYGEYSNNNLVGSCRTYYENEQLESQGEYIDGFKDGNWVFYHENGKLQRKVEYDNGSYQGQVKEFFNTGSIYTIANYNDKGNRDGIYERFNTDGEKVYSATYSDGKLIKEQTLGDKTGEIPNNVVAQNRLWTRPDINESDFKRALYSSLRKASSGWAQDRGVYQFEINEEGRITKAIAIETCNDVIDQAVIRTLLESNWKPATLDRAAVKSGNEIVIWFNYSTVERMAFGQAYEREVEIVDSVSIGEQIFHIVEEQPEFTGGADQLMKFLMETTRYPADAKDARATGVVYVQFVVGESGLVRSPSILRGVHPGLDAEAIRVVKEMPAWKPGKQRGKVVPVYYKLPFRFNLK